MDGPAGRPSDNPPNSDGLGVNHRTVPELTVSVYWQPGPPIWQRFSPGPDPDPKWRSGTVAITTRQQRWQCLRLRVCNMFNVFKVGKLVHVFDWIIDRVGFMMLSQFNTSGRAGNIQTRPAWNLKVFGMESFDMFKLPVVLGKLYSAWKFAALWRGLLRHGRRDLRRGVYTVEWDESWCRAWATWCGCKLMILSANLRDLLNLNSIARRILTPPELHKHSMHDVPYYYE